MAIRTAFGLDIHTHRHSHEGGTTMNTSISMSGVVVSTGHSHTAWSACSMVWLAPHLLAVIPALALPPLGAFSYLIAYLGIAGSNDSFVLLMAIASARWPRWLPSLVGCSGGLSIAIGIFGFCRQHPRLKRRSVLGWHNGRGNGSDCVAAIGPNWAVAAAGWIVSSTHQPPLHGADKRLINKVWPGVSPPQQHRFVAARRGRGSQ